MATLSDRIRRARMMAKLSQQTLADTVGVQRSAVAQWERANGSYPSMHHLIRIAITTQVCLEWLGTGRGPIHPTGDDWIPAINTSDYVHDDIEAKCLAALRRIPVRIREQIVGIIGLVAENYPDA
ncbi:helix-turn-helix transcriptional regulator [Marilutibacter chinensis]|uniref:Helix-turn-helix domain-containing protein n=1 Tax=Marilutibacter chinensis TaxID=2912247 RepID=A0ABS9HPG3_9GAMM|nr:helix-turn-helix transcriptional regulator [Lysobacter chinensis]MCF7220391.1 helix-turn-helix domain-containing protein [Lysobacter chinensis]